MENAFFLSFWNIIVDSAFWLIFGFVLAGILHILFSQELFIKYLKGDGIVSIIRAVLIGMPIPLCSCSVIPVAKAIRDKGAGRGAVSGFLISTPETSVDSIALSYALLGPFWAFIRPIAAISTGIISGLLQPKENTHLPKELLTIQDSENCTTNCNCSVPTSKKKNWKDGFKYAFVTLPTDLSRYLLPGMILAALLSYFFPPSSLQGITNYTFQYLAAFAIGLPLYVCSTASTPLAASLLISGISPGAVLLFLLVGPATNVANIVALKSILGTRGMLIQIVSITIVSLLFAIMVDAFFNHFEISQSLLVNPANSEEENLFFHQIFGILLLLLLSYGLLNDIRTKWFNKK